MALPSLTTPDAVVGVGEGEGLLTDGVAFIGEVTDTLILAETEVEEATDCVLLRGGLEEDCGDFVGVDVDDTVWRRCCCCCWWCFGKRGGVLISLLILSLRARSTMSSSLLLLLLSMTPDSKASKESTVRLGLVPDDDNPGDEDEDPTAAPEEKDRRLRSWMEINSLSLPGMAFSDVMIAWWLIRAAISLTWLLLSPTPPPFCCLSIVVGGGISNRLWLASKHRCMVRLIKGGEFWSIVKTW